MGNGFQRFSLAFVGKDPLPERGAVELPVGQQEFLAKRLGNFCKRRLARFDHNARGQIRVDDDNTLGGEPVGQSGLAATNATGDAHAQHIRGLRAAGIR